MAGVLEGKQMSGLSRTPALPPPDGFHSNFINPPSRADLYIVVVSIAISLMLLCVCLRLYAKIWLIRSPDWDDVTCVMATIGHLSYQGLIILSTTYGVGKHMWDVPIIEASVAFKYTKIVAIVAEPSILFTKLTLLLLYFRLFSVKKEMKCLILAGIIFCSVSYTALMLGYIFLDEKGSFIVNEVVGATNLASDIYIICLPITAILRLQLPKRKRVGIMLIFLTGLLAIIMSLLGLIFRIQSPHDNYSTTTSDVTWDLIPVFIVNSIELDVGIMCACMPFFPALAKKFPAVHQLLSSLNSLRSRLLRPRTTDTTSIISSVHQQHLKRNDYIELGEIPRLDDAGATTAPETYRMGLEGFSSGDR